MRVGFIGLGNVGSKLAGSLLRNGFDLVVRDLDRSAAATLEAGGAGWADSPAEMAAEADMVITCLPSPAASAAVMEAGDGILAGLASRAEALVTSKLAGIDLNTAYEAIRISSGNSFVHETESQMILNGSRDINFTMDLVQKDLSLFAAVAKRCGVPLELSPVLIDIFDDAAARYGPREWSPNVIRRLEEAVGTKILAPGFPPEMLDDEPEAPGREVVVHRG